MIEEQLMTKKELAAFFQISIRSARPHVFICRRAPATRQHAEKDAYFASPNIHSFKFHSFSFEANAFIMPNPQIRALGARPEPVQTRR